MPNSIARKSRTILVVCAEFPPLLGGIGSLCHALVQAAASREDLTVHVLVPPGSREVKDTTMHTSLESPSSAMSTTNTHRRNAEKVSKLIRVHSIDEIYFMDASARAYSNMKKTDVKCTIYVHGTELTVGSRAGELLSRRYRMQRRALEKADRIVVNSRATGLLLEKKLNGIAYEVIHPCLNMAHVYCENKHRSSPYEGAGEGTFIFLTVSRLAARKGHDRVLAVLSKIKERLPEFRYYIVGDGPHRDTIEAQVKRYNLENEVVFTGPVEDEALGAYYHHADLFLMFSRRASDGVEGFGLTFIEAGFSGTAAVGSDHGGVAEAILHKKTGLVVSEDNAQAAQAVLDLVANPSKRLRYAEEAKRRAATTLTPDYFCRLLLKESPFRKTGCT